MSGIIRWERPRGSVHDVARALSLVASEHCNILLVSDPTLYVIQNFFALDVEFKARWADETGEAGYTPISEDSPRYSDWVDLIHKMQSEVVDMSCELVEALTGIKDSIDLLTAAMTAQTTQQDPWDEILTDIAQALGQPVTQQPLQLAGASLAGQDFCCEPLSTLPYKDDYQSTSPNPGSSVFCDRCYSYAYNFGNAGADLMEKWSAGQIVSVSLLALIAAALAPEVALLVTILGVVAATIFEVSRDDYQLFINDLRNDIACAIFRAANAQAAQEAVRALLASAEKPNLWPEPAATTVLQWMVSITAMNEIFDGVYEIRPQNANSDCGECQPAGTFAMTRLVGPFNELVVGSSITAKSDDVDNGYLAENNDVRIDLNFTVDAEVTAWHFQAEVALIALAPPETRDYSVQLQAFIDSVWTDLVQFGPTTVPTDEWTAIIEFVDNITLSPGISYRFHCQPQDFEKQLYYRMFLAYAD